jgi:hypothetical protein
MVEHKVAQHDQRAIANSSGSLEHGRSSLFDEGFYEERIDRLST